MSGNAKLSREEFRRQKDLEAARKAGTAAPAVDEDGKAINPHIPEFMAVAPWYLSTGGGPSLKHQKAPVYNADPNKLQERFDRGAKAGPAATKFRKGACTNCGAMTHKVKDCLERPRKVGAKFTGKNIAADEVIHDDTRGLNGMEGMGDFDAKRDRWDGYDPASHKAVVQEHEALEEARRKLREEAIDAGTAGADEKAMKKLAKAGKGKKKKQDDDDDFGSSDESDAEEGAGDDEDKYAEGADVAGQRLDTKTRVTVRNLRIREDTAKYLMNLDLESAYYDPKTRSMREAPVANVRPEDAVFAGDNFARHSGGATEVQRLQLFAWQSEQRGNDVHINSNPTQSHLLHREFLEKKEALKETSSASILEKYGGEKYLERVPKELLGGQTEDYVEYSRTGQVVKGRERAKARSKYDEDVHPGNHTSVWGSYYNTQTGAWGFACCHSSVKNSYCAGQASIEAAKAEAAGGLGLLTAPPGGEGGKEKDNRSLLQIKMDKEAEEKRVEKEKRKRKAEGGADEDEEASRKKKDDKEDRDKGFGVAVTDAEMGTSLTSIPFLSSSPRAEEYHKTRDQRFDDPMAQVGKDELLPL
ncbi:Pre-mRNA splicing Prp18-interacting factor-domain-containing protein [Leucosporidium creatinivorum]|uniref:Pre-mRNA-splicing factor SLU7 n=1 Tax=Leucosporidium creatinivorum TaxID=106004 RepID=A0A1Y2G1Z5_9BASI|nr:Pre-mRNA splicing Prp18-interacting factor-domain-containing protein [Leucosporidium creatinivorum]